MQSRQSRRRLLATLSSAAGVSLIGSPNVFAQQAPPETTTIRLAKSRGICSRHSMSPRICCARKASPTLAM